ncbi:probable calcium-binding protein CML50 isoform X1 [Acanthopagrus latus]|uniref:probable calcium-binding protein CML50 isoform X1 n=2 Tax=Acanthopagrus latus TaxID=8177 RepID=UPI00187C33A5|nr:probable calcium-binding protein CML50 isoform X1 [Acanthopagrus latus]XP_036936049.1 probable calcium-binding protein CML50 isoform X1 [Acanthopagrus latus]XP_036936050.1 probable calcium-binding protein CML50 isoform X1 [Acanthopagrus latus]
MRMLWLSFLLIGHIACGPIGQDYRSNKADPTLMQEPSSSGYWYSGTGMSSGPGSSSPLPSLTNPSFNKAAELPAPQDAIYYSPSSYGSSNSPEVAPYGVAYAASPYDTGAPSGGYSGGYGSSAGVYGGYGYAPAPQDEGFGSVGSQGAGDEISEPVFSDVSDLEPVYSFSSRSNYQRGKAIFAQTRYTPGEPVAPLMPVAKSISKTASKQRSPAKATAKGRYH